MNNEGWTWRFAVLLGILCIGAVLSVKGQDSLSDRSSRRFIHGFSIEGRPEYVFPTHPFVKGENPERKVIVGCFSAHLKYSFRYRPGSFSDRVYSGVYQGIGIGQYAFGETQQLGNPMIFYLFQGARIARITSWLSLNYEWNFGLSTGWKPYNEITNPYNRMIGSRVNAYINTNFYLRWMLSPRMHLTSGVTLTHFSNGNTNFPNAGLNTIGARIGLEYDFCRKEDLLPRDNGVRTNLPCFRRHMSYDFVFFGSWRRKGIDLSDGVALSPETYPVFGFNFAPMYNLSYKLRLGLSLDGVFDGSANLYAAHGVYGSVGKSDILRPELYDQFALGISGRVEYVMPYFTVGIGMGTNFIGKGDLKAFYQLLSLKIALTKSAFLHVGYNIQEFHDPNFLMLGIGFHLNHQYSPF